MTRIIVKEIILDSTNLKHIQKHKVSEEEVKIAGKNILYHRETYNKRYLATARCGSRIITLILSRKGTGLYYLITARGADKKERRALYEKEKRLQKQNS